MTRDETATRAATHHCDICNAPLRPDDDCLFDIDLGIVHAACADPGRVASAGLETGHPTDDTAPEPFKFSAVTPRAKPADTLWPGPTVINSKTDAIAAVTRSDMPDLVKTRLTSFIEDLYAANTRMASRLASQTSGDSDQAQQTFSSPLVGEGDHERSDVVVGSLAVDTPPTEVDANPATLHGALVFAGSRLPVSAILGYIAQGATDAEICAAYPDVTDTQLNAVRQLFNENAIRKTREALTLARHALLKQPIPDDGATSLIQFGIGYWHDDEWEYTQNANELEQLRDAFADSAVIGPAVIGISTLIEGPYLWAAMVPTSVTDETEIRFFTTHAAAEAAAASTPSTT